MTRVDDELGDAAARLEQSSSCSSARSASFSFSIERQSTMSRSTLGGGRLPLDEQHQGLHELLDDVGGRPEVGAVATSCLLLLLLRLHQLELVARILRLVVEHDAPAGSMGMSLSSRSRTRLDRRRACARACRSRSSVGGLLEELHRHLLPEVLLSSSLAFVSLRTAGASLMRARFSPGVTFSPSRSTRRAVGDDPDAVRLDLLDEGVARERACAAASCP